MRSKLVSCLNIILGMDKPLFQTPKLLNTGMMARHLRVQPAWLRTEAESGRIPCVPVGTGFLFNPVAVESCLLERAKATPSEVARHA
jgi:hypothetical protein